MDSLLKYNKAFISVFNVEESVLNNDFVVGKSNNWDSIRHLSLMTAIEDEFDNQGWAAFWQEWDERYHLATALSG